MAKQVVPSLVEDPEVFPLYRVALDAAQKVPGAVEDLRVRVRNAILSHGAWREAEVEHMRVQKETHERHHREAEAERRWKEIPVPKDGVELPLQTLIGATPQMVEAGIKRAKQHWACKDIVAYGGRCRIFVRPDASVVACQEVIAALFQGAKWEGSAAKREEDSRHPQATDPLFAVD
jgi:hypothetical protein